nr:MAG TPA: major capsid protein [Bacteriophage sp.]
MTKEAYKAQREQLMNEAQALLNEGKTAEANAKMDEVKALDAKFEEAAKVQANLSALAGVRVGAPGAMPGVIESAGLSGQQTTHVVDLYDTDEYKRAFMNYVLNGKDIPRELTNADANTKTSDVGSVIPTTTLQKIYEKMKAIGMILPRVTHTAFKGGVAVPTSSVKPVASWVSEGSGSDKQKKTTGSITFGYYKLRCAISMSLEATVVTYPMFEAQFVENVSEAMVEAKEQAIISGSGTGQPKGILKETVPAGQNIDIAAASADLTYKDLVKAEAALPQAYDADAVWCMTKKTFFEQIVGMVDNNKQPVARVNYGMNGKPVYSLFGREVVLVGDYLPTFASSVTADTIFAFIFNFKNYILNENMAMTFRRYTDNATDDEVTVALELVDGKAVDVNSLVTLTKKKAAAGS